MISPQTLVCYYSYYGIIARKPFYLLYGKIAWNVLYHGRLWVITPVLQRVKTFMARMDRWKRRKSHSMRIAYICHFQPT